MFQRTRDRRKNISLSKEWICHGCEHNFIFHSLLSIFDLRVSTDPVAMADAKFHIYLRHEGALTSLWGIGVFFIPDSNYKRHQSFYKIYYILLIHFAHVISKSQ